VADNIYANVDRMIARYAGGHLFLATVTDVSGDAVQFARPGVATDGIYYQRLEGDPIVASDLILVAVLGDGTSIVLGKVVS